MLTRVRPDDSTQQRPLRQRAAILAPLLVLATMYPAFRWLDAAAGDRVHGYLGWYLGLVVYWAVWGTAFSTWLVGRAEMKRLLRPTAVSVPVFALVLFPAAMAGVVRWLMPEMAYDKPSVLVTLLLISTVLGNGITEEMLWRGTYSSHFPENRSIRVVYASVMFGLWHYVPVSLTATGPELWGMILGPTAFGFILAFIAEKTEGLFWPVVAHVVGGFVMIA